MSENLDYAMPGSYVNKKGDRLYTWTTAMKACPTGWHLPSNEDWDILVIQFGGPAMAGEALKSKTGWKYEANGTNNSGFNGIPVSYRDYYGAFSDLGKSSHYWSSAEKRGNVARSRILYYKDSKVDSYYYDKEYALSCRCLRD